MKIVEEQPLHRDAVLELNRNTFGGEDEAAIVDRLSRDGLVALSLVALEGDAVVGHILFSDLPCEMDGREIKALALAPMSVRPDRQRTGIGSALVRAGLARLSETDAEAVIVLGHEDYYPRFGFSAALASRIASPFPGPHFMALELRPGSLSGTAGHVQYPAAFGV